MNFSALFSHRLIFLDRAYTTVEEIIDHAAKAFSGESGLKAEQIAGLLYTRQKSGCTCIGEEILLPHAYADINDILVLFMRLRRSIQIANQEETASIRFVFAILASKRQTQTYLKVLRAIAQIAEAHRHDILQASVSPDDFCNRLDRAGINIDESLSAGNLCEKCTVLAESATIEHAVDMMKTSGFTMLPVVDSKGRYLGIADLLDMVAASFPEYIMRFDDLTFLGEFNPLEHFLLSQDQKAIASVIRHDASLAVDARSSWLEVLFLMAKRRNRLLVVVHDDRTVAGIITTRSILFKVIRA